MKCKGCGAILEDDACSCKVCGHKIRLKVYCEECGEKLLDGAKYCTNCGKKVSDGDYDYSESSNTDASFSPYYSTAIQPDQELADNKQDSNYYPYGLADDYEENEINENTNPPAMLGRME